MTAKRKKVLFGIGAIVLLAIIVFTYKEIMYVSTDNAQVEAHTVMLAPKVSGLVANVLVQEGQKVKKGDILVEIDDRDFQNSVTQFKASLTSVEARKKESEKNFNRIAGLYAKEAVSSQQYDSTRAAYSEVKANYDSLSAQVAQAELNLENAKIHAPANGFIAKKSVEAGQYASPGVPLIGFVDAEERWVIANFKETEIADVKVGASVDITVDALPGKTYQGTVNTIFAATGATFSLLPPDNATGNFTKVVQRVPVRIKIENLSEQEIEQLRAGLSAFVKVHKH